MAGQAPRGARRTARSSRVDSSSPGHTAVSAVVSGSDTVTTTPASPTPLPEQLIRSTYLKLIMRGLAPDEAANLTAYLAGIAVGDTHWTIRQVNQLVFLREMARNGRFAEPPEGTAP
jgi:hypothetical protein